MWTGNGVLISYGINNYKGTGDNGDNSDDRRDVHVILNGHNNL
jgi:hypothetical protein